MNSSVLFLLAAAAAAQTVAPIAPKAVGPSPGRPITAWTATLNNGIQVEVKTFISGGSGAIEIAGVGDSDGRTVHSLFYDKTSLTYLGYDVAAAPAGAAGYTVSITPLGNAGDMLTRFGADLALTPMPPPKYPPPQAVREGDTIAVDLMSSPDGRQKVTSYIRVSRLPAPEVASREVPLTFKSRVNLVTVPVVIYDAKGRAVTGLDKEDFRLFDNGKPQTISRFSVEGPGISSAPDKMPARYLAIVFDDIHVGDGLVEARTAAGRYLAESLRADDRAAIITTSGRVAIDFTNDRDRLLKALESVSGASAGRWTEPVLGGGRALFEQLSGLSPEVLNMFYLPSGLQQSLVDVYGLASLDAMDSIVRKMARMPGQRSIVLVTPGFPVSDAWQANQTDIIEAAVRGGVSVNVIDPRGVFSHELATMRASERKPVTGAWDFGAWLDDQRATVMLDLTDGTGGRLFQGNNDLDQCFRDAAALPDSLYVLGFRPQDLKLDGKLHKLKVELRNPAGYEVRARRGYFTPRFEQDPADQAKRQIEEAFFSAEEIRELPAGLETQFFKIGDDQASVSILAKIDIKQLPFRKENDRNRDDLTLVSGLFDSNGVYVAGIQKIVEMRLKDETLQRMLATGLTVRSTVRVQPGNYTVRLVVRDAEGQQLTAQGGFIEIP